MGNSAALFCVAEFPKNGPEIPEILYLNRNRNVLVPGTAEKQLCCRDQGCFLR